MDGDFSRVFMPSFRIVLVVETDSSDRSVSSDERLGTISISINMPIRNLVITLLGTLCILLADERALFQGC